MKPLLADALCGTDFLDEVKESDADCFAAVLAGLAKLRKKEYHKPPLSKPLGDGLFELRHVGKLNTRVFYFLHEEPSNHSCSWHSEEDKSPAS